MWVLMLAAMLPAGPAQQGPLFTPEERAAIVALWNGPGRYAVTAPAGSDKTGPWQVRLTPEASRWFWALRRSVSAAKLPPNQDVSAAGPLAAANAWIDKKYAFDRWAAQSCADAANAAILGRPAQPPAGDPPAHPGPAPAELVAAAGNPPPFAAAVAPLRYVVAFEDGDTYAYEDHVNVRPRYAFYRFAQGVMSIGTPLREMPDAELAALYRAAGMSESEGRVARAVSRLEGGFDAVNTYDTGYVSIGFIQFITYDDGKHSLLRVLEGQKRDAPEAFLRDFRRYGIEVNAEGTLVVVDPSSGAELVGPEAVLKVIEDKRLTAVFQRAGRRSREFRVAQIKAALSEYWPANDSVTVVVNGRTLVGRVSDIVRSEAGMATLFDRKVNTGKIAPFGEEVTRLMAERGLTSLDDVRKHERELIQKLKYRHDFLADSTLSQPK